MRDRKRAPRRLTLSKESLRKVGGTMQEVTKADCNSRLVTLCCGYTRLCPSVMQSCGDTDCCLLTEDATCFC